jgi:nitrate reductase NapE component
MEILVIVAMCLFPLIVVGLVVFFILWALRPAK